MVVSVFSSLACLLALLGLLLGLIWYVLLGDVGVGVGVAGHTSTACSDLDMPELDSMDRDVIVIVFVTESNAS
jgi:hypothetical protein